MTFCIIALRNILFCLQSYSFVVPSVNISSRVSFYSYEDDSITKYSSSVDIVQFSF